MEKIVGKIGAILLCIMSVSCAAISLRVTDRNGVPLREAVVGEPFQIEVVSSGAMRDFQINDLNPTITLLGQQTQSSQYVNGTVTIKYSFSARGDKVGEYTIGPVSAQVNGTQERSNTVSLKIVTEQEISKQQVNEVFLRLAVNKKKVMVGEQIVGSIRFYSCKDDIAPDQFIQSDLSPFTLNPMSEPIYGKEMIDKTEYTYLEISWTMAAKKAGSITIPAWCAYYSVPLIHDSFGPFRLMQSLQRQQKRVYSNAVSLEVAALPPHDGPVHGVGSFEDFKIHASSQVAKAGDANVIRLDVIGDGTFEGYDPLQLVGVSEGLKSYESKQYSEDLSNGTKKTSYEFIVQGLKAGDWEIPAQSFTYFDVSRKQYVTHKTVPLLISVLAQPALSTATAAHIATDTKVIQSNEPITDPTGMRLNVSGSWSCREYRAIPLHWFIVLLALPFCIVGMQGVRRCYAAYQLRREPIARKKYGHLRAYKAVADVEKRKAYHELYPIFVELFASRTESSIPECSDDTIATMLRERGLSQDDIAAWQRFFTDIMRLAYAGSGQQSKVTQDIIKRSYEWLGRLKGVL
jgi:hypothetical protein